jgi:hypothetical protein
VDSAGSGLLPRFLLLDPTGREKYLAHYLRCITHSDDQALVGKVDGFLEEFAALQGSEGMAVRYWVEVGTQIQVFV